MIDTPKVLNVPGYDQPLREQTLAEFVMVLDEQHLVRRELRELQRRSALNAQISAELVEAKLSITTLENELSAAKSTASAMAQGIKLEGQKSNATTPMPEIVPGVIEKIPCVICGVPIARGKGFWKRHLQVKHPKAFEENIPQE